MKTNLKFLFVCVFSIGLMSFSGIKTHTIELTNSGAALQNQNFELQNDTYLLNTGKFETLYVKITSKGVNGKNYNKETLKKENISGTKYKLEFFEKCNIKGSKLQNNKTFVTVWENGKVDAWNTEKNVQVDEYNLSIAVK